MIMPGRLVGSIPFIATVVVAALGVGALTSTARAKDCLAAPNSPAPDGSWWYYRLDWPTQRKCWYLRALGRPAQQATEGERTGSGRPVLSRSAPSQSTPHTDRALESVSTDDNRAPSPPDADTAPVGSIVPEAPAPQASTSAPPSAPTVPPTQNNEQVISAPIQQSAHEESATNSLLERPVQETSASSQTNAQAPAPVDAADVATPDAVPRIKALESNAVSTDASAASEDYTERAVRIRDQASNEQTPIRFFVIAVGLAVIGVSFHFVRRLRFPASSLNHSRQTRS
jgi:hypothetical protein